MKIKCFCLALAALSLAGCRSGQNSPGQATVAPVTVAGQEQIDAVQDAGMGRDTTQAVTVPAFISDSDFTAWAVQRGMALIKWGQVAERKGMKSSVKDFAVEMQEEHIRVNSLLMEVARENKWPTPGDLDAGQEEIFMELHQLMGDQLDRRYINLMVHDHETALAIVEEAAGKVTNPRLRSYISQITPTLEEHLQRARDIQKKLAASR